MPAPCNACPACPVGRNYRTGVEFPDSSGTPLGIQQGVPISLGPTPWNLYHAHNRETNGYIEVESLNFLTPDATIPLGIRNADRRLF